MTPLFAVSGEDNGLPKTFVFQLKFRLINQSYVTYLIKNGIRYRWIFNTAFPGSSLHTGLIWMAEATNTDSWGHNRYSLRCAASIIQHFCWYIAWGLPQTYPYRGADATFCYPECSYSYLPIISLITLTTITVLISHTIATINEQYFISVPITVGYQNKWYVISGFKWSICPYCSELLHWYWTRNVTFKTMGKNAWYHTAAKRWKYELCA